MPRLVILSESLISLPEILMGGIAGKGSQTLVHAKEPSLLCLYLMFNSFTIQGIIVDRGKVDTYASPSG